MIQVFIKSATGGTDTDIAGSGQPAPAFEWQEQAGQVNPVTGQVVTVKRTLKISGQFVGSSIGTKRSALDGLINAFNATSGTVTVKLSSTPIFSLTGAGAVNGLNVVNYSYPNGKDVEWAAYLSYQIEFTGEYETSTFAADFVSVQVATKTETSGPQTITWSGTLTAKGGGAAASIDAWITANCSQSSGWARSKTITTSENDLTVSFSVTDTEGSNTWAEVTLSTSTGEDGRQTKTWNGTLTARPGQTPPDASAWVANTENIPAVSSGWQRTVQIGQTVQQQSFLDQTATFTVTDRELVAAFPANCYEGSVSYQTSEMPNGEKRLNVSATFKGTGAATAIEAVKADEAFTGLPLLSREESHDEYSDSYTLSMSFLQESPDVISQTVSIRKSLYDFSLTPVLNGGDPVKQTTVKRPASATQSGSITKLGSWPTAIAPLWPNSLKQHNITYAPPEKTVSGDWRYTVSWEYSFEHYQDFTFNPETMTW